MKQNNCTLTAIMLIVGLTAALPVRAVDVETQQYNVNAAQKIVDKAQVKLDEATERVKRQNQRIAQEQAILKDLQKKQAATQTEYDQAKADLDVQQKALDEAWIGKKK